MFLSESKNLQITALDLRENILIWTTENWSDSLSCDCGPMSEYYACAVIDAEVVYRFEIKHFLFDNNVPYYVFVGNDLYVSTQCYSQ